MIGRTNTGGGGGKLFAVIGVTYPADSTCTCTNGSRTLKAKDTSGQALFAVPYAGTWIVTATDGTETASQSVEISAEGQNVSVKLSYRFLIYDYGLVAGYDFAASSDESYTFTKNADNLYFSQKANSYGGIWTTTKVNVNNFSVLGVKFRSWGGTVLNSAKNLFGLSSETGYNKSYVATESIDGSPEVVEVDIQNVTGDYYVRLQTLATSGGLGTSFEIVEIWLK